MRGHPTGAANGLAGADVACADIDEESARATAEVVQGLGRRGTAIRCDVTVEAEVEAMVRRTVEALGRLDILFNNAGIADPQALLLHQYPTADWRAVLDVDLDGVFYCAREALKVMVAQQSGKIINIDTPTVPSPPRSPSPPRAMTPRGSCGRTRLLHAAAKPLGDREQVVVQVPAGLSQRHLIEEPDSGWRSCSSIPWPGRRRIVCARRSGETGGRQAG
jgi:NAD(P)-dependent dehydrogenase (short-subunit alcohol dehydrogenase family)